MMFATPPKKNKKSLPQILVVQIAMMMTMEEVPLFIITKNHRRRNEKSL
jgi:hypothetical protein